MYAKVVVLTYQPPEPGYFTYKIPPEMKIKPGQLVKVPFGKREPLGIVLTTRNGLDRRRLTVWSTRSRLNHKILNQVQNDEINYKNISEIVLPDPLLPLHLIDLLKWMASYYQAPLVNCLEAMMPEIPKRLSPEYGQGRTLRSSLQGSTSSTLVLVPTINRLAEIMAKYPQAKNPVQFHNQLKTSEKFANWLAILSGQADYIFGSRSAIFAPTPNLKKIIIYDEHDGAYKDERSPYYDTLTVAQKIAQFTVAKIEIIDSAPRITTYFQYEDSPRTKSAHIKWLEDCPRWVHRTFIVGMAQERQMGNFTHLSGLLEDFIRRNYKKGGKTLLFLNKKAESGQFYCKNCTYQGYFNAKPFSCPKCKSRNFNFYTTNLFTLANEVKKLVDITPKLIAEDKTFRPHFSPSLVDITTSYIFYAQTFAKYQLAAHIAADTTLNRTGYTAPEIFYSEIQSLKNLLIEKGVLVIQTYDPNNPVVKAASSDNYKAFYENELSGRKQLKYPPYAIFVKITGHGKDKEKALRDTKNLTENIKRLNYDGLTVLGPSESRASRSEARFSIILKKELKNYSLQAREKALTELHDVISPVKKDFQVIVEPGDLD